MQRRPPEPLFRDQQIETLSRETFDLAIIGGGITGAGIALDAAARGLKVALIDKGDFAGGTSSKSTKLVHGGLRYLEQRHFRLTREALRERALLYHSAPFLVNWCGFLVPTYRDKYSHTRVEIGLWLYDLLARSSNTHRHHSLEKNQLFNLAPQLRRRDLTGASQYFDCMTQDSRLVIEVIKTAVEHGALVANYAAAFGFFKQGHEIKGIEVADLLRNTTFLLRASQVINASGVWCDQVRQLDFPEAPAKIRPSKGVHLVLQRKKISCHSAILAPSVHDGRFIFILPWHEVVIVGTTDTDFEKELDHPEPEKADIAYLLDTLNWIFPEIGLEGRDIVTTYAGLRPLIQSKKADSKDVSREEAIFESDSGLISIAGGKLTTFRIMAERLVNRVATRLVKLKSTGISKKSNTAGISLGGGPIALKNELFKQNLDSLSREYQVDPSLIIHLIKQYGINYREILQIIAEHNEAERPLAAGLPFVQAEAIYSGRYEMAVQLQDFLERRSRIGLCGRRADTACLELTAASLGKAHGWTKKEQEAQIQNYSESGQEGSRSEAEDGR